MSRKEKWIGGLILAVFAALMIVDVLTAQVAESPDPREWQLIIGNVLTQNTDETTGELTFRDSGTAFMFNRRTGITYKYFNICPDRGTHGCFSQIAYDLSYKGATGYYIRPDPTSAAPGAMPQ